VVTEKFIKGAGGIPTAVYAAGVFKEEKIWKII